MTLSIEKVDFRVATEFSLYNEETLTLRLFERAINVLNRANDRNDDGFIGPKAGDPNRKLVQLGLSHVL